ncbi:MAG: hypothetical protein IIC85_09700, partial [Chloroflexi bacterium]|nr:hypothetical protein [Chloroflexota bacterium]
YEWGDYTQDQYKARREDIERQLRTLEPPPVDHGETLDKLAGFLQDLALAWEAADYEQRNKLARCLFEEIWVRDKKVVAVKPRGEFEPFFRLNLEEDGCVNENIELATPTGVEPAISALTAF